MYVCVCPCPCVCVRKTFMRKEREMKMKKKKEKRNKKKKRKKRENYKLIHTDKRTDRQKSFIDMRYYTEQYSKSNSIKENRTKSNQIDLK